MAEAIKSQKGRVAKGQLSRSPKTKGLTPKQAKFVRGVAEGKPGRQAAMDAYDTDSLDVANAISVENLQKPSVREAIDRAFEELEITPKQAIMPIARALNFDHENPVVELDMQLKGSDRALKLMGATDNDSPKGNVFNFHLGNTFIKNDIKPES